jgi:hypothetical protein
MLVWLTGFYNNSSGWRYFSFNLFVCFLFFASLHSSSSFHQTSLTHLLPSWGVTIVHNWLCYWVLGVGNLLPTHAADIVKKWLGENDFGDDVIIITVQHTHLHQHTITPVIPFIFFSTNATFIVSLSVCRLVTDPKSICWL